ncbi:ATP synthase subunit I [Shewanella avicenniae]|uniref:ATP synthase subunit I n=1 Tax=Shewanella avicenniae TaxID=2814294 RepID=A0ABX7QSI6_9GAMM|nr:ATP synthase subunit I [Shewanella avicenniae]QSX33665.1 ATP synthase subunit I [Shewanella avicenniae]
MSKILAHRCRKSALKLVGSQAVVAGGASAVFFALWGVQFGMSAFAGAAIAVLPNLVFAILAFAHVGATASAKVLKGFYWGEAIKMLSTIALFSLVFINMEVAIVPLFICYLLGLMVHWAAPLYLK